MSKYTTELRFIIETCLKDKGVDMVQANWKMAYNSIGLGTYPIFEEVYRETLNNKIIRHYYTREIGAETVGRFRMFVEDAMELIMPYYNQMYESLAVANKLEPLHDHKMSSSSHSWGESSSKGDNKSNSESNLQNVFSDTPASSMIPEQIKKLEYATNVTLDEDNSKSQSESKSNSDFDAESYQTTEGFTRPQAELLKLYRTTFINIDRDIVNDIELSQCFMTIW